MSAGVSIAPVHQSVAMSSSVRSPPPAGAPRLAMNGRCGGCRASRLVGEPGAGLLGDRLDVVDLVNHRRIIVHGASFC